MRALFLAVLVTFAAAPAAKAGFVTTITIYSVNQYFNDKNGEAIDSYLRSFFSQNNVLAEFTNRAVVRRTWAATAPGNGSVQSTLAYKVIFLGDGAEAALATYAAALRDEMLWYGLLEVSLAGCSAEALYRGPRTGPPSAVTVCAGSPLVTVLPPTAGTPCTYSLPGLLCSPPPPPDPPPPPLAPPAAPAAPPPPWPSPPPRPPYPPGAGPCGLIVKAVRPAIWPPASACSQLVSAVNLLCTFRAQMLPDRGFQCFNDGSRNGQMIVVGTAASREDAQIIASNFAQRRVAAAALRVLGGMRCDSALRLEGSTCGVRVQYDSSAHPELFGCFSPPPPVSLPPSSPPSSPLPSPPPSYQPPPSSPTDPPPSSPPPYPPTQPLPSSSSSSPPRLPSKSISLPPRKPRVALSRRLPPPPASSEP